MKIAVLSDWFSRLPLVSQLSQQPAEKATESKLLLAKRAEREIYKPDPNETQSATAMIDNDHRKKREERRKKRKQKTPDTASDATTTEQPETSQQIRGTKVDRYA